MSRLAHHVVGAVNLGIVVLDAERRIVLWNHWMEQHSGLSSEKAVGSNFFVLLPELAGKRIEGAVTQALRDHFPSVLSQTLHKSPLPLFATPLTTERGERLAQAVAVTPIDIKGAAPHCLIQVTDVSVAVNREKLLRDQALELRSQTISDGLTGIANRRHFDVTIDKEVRRAKRAASPLTLLMIDIDCFKAYNDFYGHQQGDDCLINVAKTLSSMLNRPTDLIARYGGEEFAVVLPDTDGERGQLMAESMRKAISGLQIPHENAGATRVITVSIGIASQVLDSPVDVPALIRAADRALYVAKRCGRDRVVAQTPEAT
jgi:diguanylate cyclase (GGDEF)-like protein/PAS domain S-box-containing protein